MVSPFEEGSVCAGTPPSKWTPRFEYGGERFPIRLEVFLHALSALDKNGVQFGDYKKAHLLPEDDVRWLHQDEVSLPQLQAVVGRQGE